MNTPCPQFTQIENVKLPPSPETVMAVPVQFETEVTSYTDQHPLEELELRFLKN
jgi:hypothetical protein